MKTLFLVILPFYLFAGVAQIEQAIYATILHNLFPKKKIIYVWSDEKEDILKKISGVKVVHTLKRVDIAFVDDEEDIYLFVDKDIPIFVEKYYLLKKFPDKIIGGFFWRKGRPNIIFFRQNLYKFGLHPTKELEPYIEDKL